MIDTLIALTETGEFQDCGGLRFLSVQQSPDGLQLELALIPGDGGDEQRWRIQCGGVHDYRINGESAENLQVVSKHPILLPFTEQAADLYFSGPAPTPLAITGALWERHRQLAGSWLPFEQFLNVLPKGLSVLLSASSGQLASGPVSLMQGYSEVLADYGVRTSMLQPRPPKVWDGIQWVDPSSRLQALILTTSYVVAERFDAVRMAA